MCCSVLQCVSVIYGALQCRTVRRLAGEECNIWQHVAVCCVLVCSLHFNTARALDDGKRNLMQGCENG